MLYLFYWIIIYTIGFLFTAAGIANMEIRHMDPEELLVCMCIFWPITWVLSYWCFTIKFIVYVGIRLIHLFDRSKY